MNISVIGGGNMGCVLATRFSQKHNVILYISNRNNEIINYQNNMKMYNPDKQHTITGNISKITDSLEYAINNSDYIFITYPQFLFKNLSEQMLPYLNNKHIMFVPGSGGAEFWFKNAIDKGCTITGLQRVHAVTRIVEKGKLATEKGIRETLKIASIPMAYNNVAKEVISQLYEMSVELLPNYANITLINSNPILHTSRLYCLFNDYSNDKQYNYIPLFYEEWDEESSDLLIKLDNELRGVLDTLNNKGLDMSGIVPILNHYESTNQTELTKKLNSINSLKGIETPHIKVGNMCVPDFSSRYFISDFPYGLDLILEFALICNTQCDNIKKVSDWYHNITVTQQQFYLNDFKINDINDIVKFYSA